MNKDYWDTRYKKFAFVWTLKTFLPENCVGATPVKIFGKTIGYKLIMARPNYKYSQLK